MSFDDEFFGSPDRVSLARRGASLFRLLQDDPRFAFYGRMVALSEPREDAADVLAALTRMQGASVSYFFPAVQADAFFAEMVGRGFAMDRHEHYRGGEAAYGLAQALLAAHAMPADLTVTVLDAHSPIDLVRATAELCEACEVMPVPGAVMRGLRRQGICLVATDGDGRPAATAASFVLHHPASPRATDVFWGMLATRQDRRGEKIALLLGAQAIVHMWERHGARGFMTGVRANNASSQALCHKLGVRATDWIYASCLDQTQFGGKSVTK